MLSNVLTVHVFFVAREKSVQECSTRELCCQVLPPRVQTFSTDDAFFACRCCFFVDPRGLRLNIHEQKTETDGSEPSCAAALM